MIYTVTVNPCLDVLRFLRSTSASLTDGTYRPENPNEHEKLRPGGKGLDVSRALVCLGTATRALGFIGDQTGDIVKGLIEAEGIDHAFIESGVETRTNIIVVLQGGDDHDSVLGEIRINSQGKEIPPNKFHLLYDQASRITDADAVGICGSLPFNIQQTFYNALIARFKKNPNCTVVLDGPAMATAEAMRLPQHRPDFIKPNLKEFNDLLIELFGDDTEQCLWPPGSEMPAGIGDEQYLEYVYTGTTIDQAVPKSFVVDENTFGRKWQHLLGRVLSVKKEFGVGVLLSLGPRGCLTTSADNDVLHAYLPQTVDARTRVGAGDSLVAGFLADHVKSSGNVAEALRGGVAAATARVGVEEHGNTNRFLSAKAYDQWRELIIVDVYRAGESLLPQFMRKAARKLTRFGASRRRGRTMSRSRRSRRGRVVRPSRAR